MLYETTSPGLWRVLESHARTPDRTGVSFSRACTPPSLLASTHHSLSARIVKRRGGPAEFYNYIPDLWYVLALSGLWRWGRLGLEHFLSRIRILITIWRWRDEVRAAVLAECYHILIMSHVRTTKQSKVNRS